MPPLRSAATLAACTLASACTRPAAGGKDHLPAVATSSPAPRDAKQAARAPEEPSSAPFALVELFTSEGCSSCPPADENLARIARAHAAQRVFVLSFHVDYWNRLGWTDPFSASAYSERQGAYARRFGTRGVYTPQMVVNGEHEFVGSHRGESDAAIERALSAAGQGQLAVSVRTEGGRIDAACRFDAVEPSDLVVAVTQASATTSVPRGENAGRTLRHVGVVRALGTKPVAGRGEATLSFPLPRSSAAGGGKVVAWLQARDDLSVTAADSAPL